MRVTVLSVTFLVCSTCAVAFARRKPDQEPECSGLSCFDVTQPFWGDEFSCGDDLPVTPNAPCSDRFNGRSQDPKWTIIDLGTRPNTNEHPNQIYSKDNLAIVRDDNQNDVLRIYSYFEGDYYSGGVRSEWAKVSDNQHKGFRWGRIDIRANLKSAGGGPFHWPSVWLAHPECDLSGGCKFWPFEMDLADVFTGVNRQEWGYLYCIDGTFACPKEERIWLRAPLPFEPAPILTGFHVYTFTREPANSFGRSGPARICMYIDYQPPPVPCVDQGQDRIAFPQYDLTFDFPPAQVLDSETGDAPILQIILNAAIGGKPSGFGQSCGATSECPTGQVCWDGYCAPDPATMPPETWTDIDWVRVYQPPPCPSSCQDLSPSGTQGYVCDCD